MTPAGRISHTLMSVASDNPLLCMVIVYLIESPTTASVTLVTSVKLNIMLGMTVILSLALLTTVLFWALLANMTLVKLPAAVAFTIIWISTDFPALILFMVQVVFYISW